MPVILSNLSPLDNPAQVVQATLRALLNLADAAMLAVPPSGLDVSSLADAVFAPQHLESLCLILSSSPLHASSSSPPPSSTEPSESPSLPPVPFSVPTTATLHDQIHLLCGLIGRLCREERHQFQLATCGVLDSLATRLASFVVADGQVLPPASSSAPGSRGSSAAGDGDEPDEADVDDDRLLAELIPEPAPRGLRLGPVLEAIAAIIGDSGFRVSKLVYSPSMLAVFPPRPALPSGDGFWAAPRRALEAAGLSYPRNARATAMDYLLPAVPTHHPRTTSSLMTPFPPLGLSASVDNLSSNGRGTGSSGKQTATGLSLWQSTASESPGAGNGESGGVSVTETALIPWLMTLVRSRDGIERLMAASVLTSLFKADFANESREAALGLLVVPVLLQLLADNAPPSEKASQQVLIDDGTTRRWAIRELTPAVLARLITDSDVLQKAAFDCDAVTLLRSVIKEGYEPVPDSALAELWSPTPAGSATPEPQQPDALSAACRLGPKGLHPLLAHNLRVRESALKAIGALAAFKEEYRKAFVEHDVVGYLVESLSRSPSKPRSNKERAPAGPQKKAGENASPTDAARYGTNPESVIIAACHALRMFSRSVSILRTSLLDFGVAEPIFQLLKHPDVDIQIAATAVVCNLVTEVSPMRQVCSYRLAWACVYAGSYVPVHIYTGSCVPEHVQVHVLSSVANMFLSNSMISESCQFYANMHTR